MRGMRCCVWLSLAMLSLGITAASASDLGGLSVKGHIRWIDDSVRGTAKPAAGVGAAGVMVSNGREIARTDDDGRYAISLRSGDTLFVIKPADAASILDADGHPVFWRHHFPEGSPRLRFGGIETTTSRPDDWDFLLVPKPKLRQVAQPLRVWVLGDPQTANRAQVDYFERDIVAPLIASGQYADLGMTLGDVVDDDLDLLPLIRDATAKIGVPWIYAAGNHDIDFDAATDAESLLSYRSAMGPDTLAWLESDANFILLDDVIYSGSDTRRYVGGLREDQFEFLAALLPMLDHSKRLVVGAHIPLFDPEEGVESFRRADRERLFELLVKFERPLLVTAHGHLQRHYRHSASNGWQGSVPLHEYNVGAACGGFWSGAKDAEGIPDARMADGTPNGYARLTIEGSGDYRLEWFSARDLEQGGIELHAPRVLLRDAWPNVGLFANVFMGQPDDAVEMRVDEGEWQPMQRVDRADPSLLAINLADDAADHVSGDFRAVEAKPSTHLWRFSLPTHLALGEHRIEVRTMDRWRGELRAETSYTIIAEGNGGRLAPDGAGASR